MICYSRAFKMPARMWHLETISRGERRTAYMINEQLELLKQCLAGLKEYREREERMNNILG